MGDGQNLRAHAAGPAAAAQANHVTQADRSGFGAPAAQQVGLCWAPVLTGTSVLSCQVSVRCQVTKGGFNALLTWVAGKKAVLYRDSL